MCQFLLIAESIIDALSHKKYGGFHFHTKKMHGQTLYDCAKMYSYISHLPGGLFSPSYICKKLSHHFPLDFPIGMGSYDHQAKFQGVFPQLLEHAFFIRVETEKLNEKFCFLGAKETFPDILHGGHRNPYQLENAIKLVGQFFANITWAKQSIV